MHERFIVDAQMTEPSGFLTLLITDKIEWTLPDIKKNKYEDGVVSFEFVNDSYGYFIISNQSNSPIELVVNDIKLIVQVGLTIVIFDEKATITGLYEFPF